MHEQNLPTNRHNINRMESVVTEAKGSHLTDRLTVPQLWQIGDRQHDMDVLQ